MWNRETVQGEEPRAAQPSASPVTVSVASRPTEERRVVAWVGKSVLFRGDLIGLEDMVIDGRVEGTIELREHSLTIGPDAHIQADVVAKVVTVHGAIVGTITASEAIHIAETGSVEGNVTSPRLAMADGAVVKGVVDAGRKSEAPPKAQSKVQVKTAG
jgi:cytoskeletal protein CcmA (bactofilin family)